MGDSRLSARFGADTSDFKQGIVAINRELKLVEGEFRATASTMGDWANNADGLKARMGALTKEIGLQGEKVDALRIRAEQLAKAHGENSVEAQNAGIEFNREAEKLGKLQTELGQTERGLKGMKDASGGVRGVFKDLGKQFDNLKQQVPVLGTAFAMLTNPITLAVAGLTAFVAISKKSITELVNYNKKIRETMQLTGLSAEETSRLVQVSDDWGLNIDTATAAMEMMNKKGVTPSIDNLAKIADEYVNAADKTLFIENATKLYGKSFGNLVPILVKGGDALREQAASINDNLIATEDSIKASRDYEVAMDDLGDSVAGLKYNLGKELLPAIIGVTKGLNDLIVSQMDTTYVFRLTRKAFDEGRISAEDYLEINREIQKQTYQNNAVLQELIKTDKGYIAYSQAVNVQDAIRRKQLPDVTAATEDLTLSTEELAKKTSEANLAQAESERQAGRLMQAYDDMNAAISGRLGPVTEDFVKTQGDLGKKMQDVKTEIDNAIRDGYNPLGEKILGLQGDYDTLKGQYTINETEHDRATKEIMFDILEQRAAIGGLTADEIEYLDQISQAWGLVDQATLDYMKQADESLSYLADHPEDAAGAEKILDGQASAWGRTRQQAILARDAAIEYRERLAELKDRIIYITTHYTEVRDPDVGGPHARGLNIIIPPGYENDNYPLGTAKTGERVLVIPPGEQFGNSLANMQQLFNRSTSGLNSQASMSVSGRIGSGLGQAQLQPAPIYVTIQGAPDNELGMRRLARYVANEIQRSQL